MKWPTYFIMHDISLCISLLSVFYVKNFNLSSISGISIHYEINIEKRKFQWRFSLTVKIPSVGRKLITIKEINECTMLNLQQL